MAAGVPKNTLHRVSLVDIFECLPDHDDKFRLVIHLATDRRKSNVVPGTNDRLGKLVEDHRLCGNLGTRFRSMIRII